MNACTATVPYVFFCMYLRYLTAQVTYVATAQREGKGKKERLRESKMEDQGDDKAAVVTVEGEDPIVFYSPPAGFITVSRRMREREKERNDASDDR